MIIKYNTNTGEVIATIPETYELKDSSIGFIQVLENGISKYNPGDIKTLVLGPEIAKDYEDPRKPEKNIHKTKIVIEGKKHFLLDKGIKHQLKLDKNGILEKV